MLPVCCLLFTVYCLLFTVYRSPLALDYYPFTRKMAHGKLRPEEVEDDWTFEQVDKRKKSSLALALSLSLHLSPSILSRMSCIIPAVSHIYLFHPSLYMHPLQTEFADHQSSNTNPQTPNIKHRSSNTNPRNRNGVMEYQASAERYRIPVHILASYILYGFVV